MNFKDIKKISSPSYLQKFKCLGSDCDFTCCGGWDIAVDRDSFKLVQKTINKSCTHSQDILSKNKSFSRPEFYGKLHLRNCMCPLLDSDYLCSLQKAYGENALPLSCATFPRVNNYINGTLQKSARLSCPEIARLVLNDEDFTLFEVNYSSYEVDTNSRFEIANEINNSNSKNLSNYFFEIQNFVIGIIKNRSITIEERLSYLILFISDLVKISTPFHPNHLQALFSSIGSLINNNKNEKSIMKDIDFQHEFLIGNIIVEHIKLIKSLNTQEKYPKILKSLEKYEQLDSSAFEICLESHYKKFCQNNSFIFENFLLNWVLNEVFPFKTESFHYETVRLIINFSLIRYLIIANSLDEICIEKNDVIDIIFNYSRTFGNTELPKLRTSFRANRDEVFDLLYILNNI